MGFFVTPETLLCALLSLCKCAYHCFIHAAGCASSTIKHSVLTDIFFLQGVMWCVIIFLCKLTGESTGAGTWSVSPLSNCAKAAGCQSPNRDPWRKLSAFWPCFALSGCRPRAPRSLLQGRRWSLLAHSVLLWPSHLGFLTSWLWPRALWCWSSGAHPAPGVSLTPFLSPRMPTDPRRYLNWVACWHQQSCDSVGTEGLKPV